jgi:hypothetical protein
MTSLLNTVTPSDFSLNWDYYVLTCTHHTWYCVRYTCVDFCSLFLSLLRCSILSLVEHKHQYLVVYWGFVLLSRYSTTLATPLAIALVILETGPSFLLRLYRTSFLLFYTFHFRCWDDRQTPPHPAFAAGFLPGLTSKCDPPDLSFPHSWENINTLKIGFFFPQCSLPTGSR